MALRHLVSGSLKEVPMDFDKKYPKLVTLIAGYYHPSWSREVLQGGGRVTEEVILQRALSEGPIPYLIGLRDDITRILVDVDSEHELRKIIREEFSGAIDPALNGSSMRVWLTHISDQINRKIRSNEVYRL